jgi:hypothetical protein
MFLCSHCHEPVDDDIIALLVRVGELQEQTIVELRSVMSQQAQVDTDVATLTTAFGQLSDEVASLQAANAAAGSPLDLSALDSIANQFASFATSEAPPATTSGTGSATQSDMNAAPATAPVVNPAVVAQASTDVGSTDPDPAVDGTVTPVGSPDVSGVDTPAAGVQGADGVTGVATPEA